MIKKENNLRFLFLSISLLVLFAMISIVHAARLNWVPKLDLCTEKGCFSSTAEIKLKPDEPLMLKVTIINDQGVWICWDSVSYSFYLESHNLRDGRTFLQSNSYTSSSGNPSFCLKPAREQENVFYVPLRPYNELSKDNQLGEWKISSFSFSLNNMKCYKDYALKNSECSDISSESGSPFKGNDVKFNIAADEPHKGFNSGNLASTFFKVLAIVTGIFLVISATAIFNSKKRNRSKWIAATMILVIIAFFLVKYGFWT